MFRQVDYLFGLAVLMALTYHVSAFNCLFLNATTYNAYQASPTPIQDSSQDYVACMVALITISPFSWPSMQGVSSGTGSNCTTICTTSETPTYCSGTFGPSASCTACQCCYSDYCNTASIATTTPHWTGRTFSGHSFPHGNHSRNFTGSPFTGSWHHQTTSVYSSSNRLSFASTTSIFAMGVFSAAMIIGRKSCQM